MCKVHGTGYQAAVANVEAATHQRYIKFDLRYTLPEVISQFVNGVLSELVFLDFVVFFLFVCLFVFLFLFYSFVYCTNLPVGR